MYRECKRTHGISTTSLIERILHPSLSTSDTHSLRPLLDAFANSCSPRPAIVDLAGPGPHEILVGPSELVYIGGSWDCFGRGHVEYLRRAKEAASALGGRPRLLVVGIYSDQVLRVSAISRTS
jgi:ethanolamine-phosphate cytidylyltransferase